ncbi:DUF6343 family protein [Nonomuraea sp. NPDC005983]|uniref:DUF6343 family protein n=1 Tax=Nonomuraea sp. NPDC005983 TaxID=3155595 RepID=UPI00339DD433
MWLRNRAGTEPVTALSALRARRVLSIIALVVGVAAAGFFGWLAAGTGEAVWGWEAAIAAAVSVIAAVDLAMIARHRRQNSPPGHHQEQSGR